MVRFSIRSFKSSEVNLYPFLCNMTGFLFVLLSGWSLFCAFLFFNLKNPYRGLLVKHCTPGPNNAVQAF